MNRVRAVLAACAAAGALAAAAVFLPAPLSLSQTHAPRPAAGTAMRFDPEPGIGPAQVAAQVGDTELLPAPKRQALLAADVPPAKAPVATQPAARQPEAVVALATNGIPAVALAAYRRASQLAPCVTPWSLLAGIGRVESNHGRFAGTVLYSDGSTLPRILGAPLNGNGTALIRDTDGGRFDGDKVYDRAVGPMQFIPGTWAGWGVDASGDHLADPNNIFDAAAASARYLCAASGGDLSTEKGQVRGVFAYNHLMSYVDTVLALEAFYSGRPAEVPITGGAPKAPPAAKPTLPPVNVGTPPAIDEPDLPETGPAPAPAGDPANGPAGGTVSAPPTAPGSATPATPTATPTTTGTPTPTDSSSPSTSTPDPSPSGPSCPPETAPTDTPSPSPSPTETTTPEPDPTACPTDTGSETTSPAPTDTAATAAGVAGEPQATSAEVAATDPAGADAAADVAVATGSAV
jgi:membrane-bound lytic murein transglycosylase B